MIIINKGKLVATDSVRNLTNRLRGSETVLVEVEPRDGAIEPPQIQQRLEQVPGVSRVLFRDAVDGRSRFEVESLQGKTVRAELARAVVESGWNLNELHAAGLSLEEIFLELTAPDRAATVGGAK